MPKQFRDVRIFPLQENLLVVVFKISFHHFSRSPRKLRLARTKDLSLFTQGGRSAISLLFSVGLLLYHDKNTSSNPHFLLLLYIQNIPVKPIQLGWIYWYILNIQQK